MNVLKPHQKGAVITLLENEVSQHEISRKSGIDRKTVRKLAHAVAAARSGEGSKSPMATGSAGVPVQIPPPRPTDLGARSPLPGCPRTRARPVRGIASGSKRFDGTRRGYSWMDIARYAKNARVETRLPM